MVETLTSWYVTVTVTVATPAATVRNVPSAPALTTPGRLLRSWVVSPAGRARPGSPGLT